MSYDIGTHIDLSHINRHSQVKPARQKKSIKETAQLWSVGSKIIFVRLFPTIETIVIAPV